MQNKKKSPNFYLGLFHFFNFRLYTIQHSCSQRIKRLITSGLKSFLLFIVICFTFSQKIISQNTIKSNSIISSLSYFKENKNYLEEEILLKDFKTMPKTYSLGINNGSYWIKLILNKTKYSQNYVAYIPTHNIDLVEVYQIKKNKLEYLTSTGNSILENKLKINFKFPAFKINSNNELNNIYYLKVRFPKEANFPLKIIRENKFINYILNKKTINALYYGSCFIFILINIFFFIKFREINYWYYLLFFTSLMANFLLFDGSFINVFRGNTFYYKLELLVHVSSIIWFLLFSIKFLNLHITIPNKTKLFFIFPFAVICFYTYFLITNNYMFVAIADIIGISIFPILWIYSIYLIKKTPSSKFFVLGYSLIIPFAVFFIIGYPFGYWEVHGDMAIVKIASWLDVIVFTYAISYRMKNKIDDGELNIEELKKSIETEKALIEKKKLESNPYLIFLKENNISEQPLTSREVDILKFLNEGYNNKEISEELFISLNTVKHHVKNIYKKVDVNTRIDLKEKLALLL